MNKWQIKFERKVLFHNAKDQHELVVTLTTFFGMGGLAIAVTMMICWLHGIPLLSYGAIVSSIIAAYSGLIVALFMLPIQMLCLRRKPMRVAGPIIYGGGFFAIALLTYSWRVGIPAQIIRSSIGIVVMVTSMAIICRLFLPDDPQLVASQLCPKCGYDLRADRGTGCPECGWGRG